MNCLSRDSPKKSETYIHLPADFFVTFAAFCSTSRLFARRPRLIALNRGCSRLFAPTTGIRVIFFEGAWSRFFRIESGLAADQVFFTAKNRDDRIRWDGNGYAPLSATP